MESAVRLRFRVLGAPAACAGVLVTALAHAARQRTLLLAVDGDHGGGGDVARDRCRSGSNGLLRFVEEAHASGAIYEIHGVSYPTRLSRHGGNVHQLFCFGFNKKSGSTYKELSH